MTALRVTWWDKASYPEKYEALYNYCKQDIRVERAKEQKLYALSPAERQIQLLDGRINRRGVGVDLPAARAALHLVRAEQRRLDSEMGRLTEGVVSGCGRVAQLKDWLCDLGFSESIAGLDKMQIQEYLKRDDLDPRVRQGLLYRAEFAKSSTAKLEALINWACPDGRIRGMFQFHGAGQTGRWAGRGPQPQNFPRPRKEMTPAAQEEVMMWLGLVGQGNNLSDSIAAWPFAKYGSVLQVISDCLRGFFVPAPGYEFYVCDYASIEARVLAWLANDLKKIEAFKTHGKIYEMNAAIIFGKTLEQIIALGKDSFERFIGKCAELALGYGGGAGAFLRFAEGFGVRLDEDPQVAEAKAEEIKAAWRRGHPRVVSLWYELEEAAVRAATGRGTESAAGGRIKYKKANGYLWCQLPSGRTIAYPAPQVESTSFKGRTRHQLTYMGVDDFTKKWTRQRTYGGKLTENVVQAASSCLLRNSLTRVEARGWPVVLQVHDELVAEIASGSVELKEYEHEVCVLPGWAEGLPMAVEGWKGRRYRK